MKTNPTAPQLTESEVERIATRKTNSYGSMVNLPIAERDALIRDWRTLKTERDGLTENYRIASNAVREAESNRDNAVQLVESLRQRLTVKSELLDKAMAQALELDTQNAALREQLAQANAQIERLNTFGESMLRRLEAVAGIQPSADHGWEFVVSKLELESQP